MTLIALWKPYGVVSRFTAQSGHPGLATLVDAPDVWPIGRLDRDSEGLLLLGDDGALAHALTDPRHAHPRTYWVQVEGEPGSEALGALARGVVVQGRRTRPARARPLRGEPALPARA
ncbi:MAG: pseudouridine synthase, partial [Myxococcales bacterium]|nr:pseudouridine synthase [Myxococcales bacterium]